MAPKRLPLEDPPSASTSSSEDDVESEEITDKEEEEEEEEEEEGQKQEVIKQTAESEDEEEESEDEEKEEEEENDEPTIQKPAPMTTNPTPTPQPHSSSDSEEGSDSETHSGQIQPSPTASDFTIKPIASKPMDDSSTKPKKPTSKPAAATPPTAKRPPESEKNANESRKRKAKVPNGDDEEKKSGGAITRLWSEDDEIGILKGMIEYQLKKGADPNADMGEFHDFIKKSLHVDVSRNQLMDKIRRLKKKYRNNVAKGENGDDPAFSKPHEHKSFELSKKIWGGNAADTNGKSSKKRARKTLNVNNSIASPMKENGKEIALIEGPKDEIKDAKVDKEDFWAMYPRLKESLEMEASSHLSMSGPGKIFMIENMSVIGRGKAKELDKKWKNLRAEEVALYLKKVEVIEEQTKLMLDGLKSSE